MQGWNEQLENSSRANTYELVADFQLKIILISLQFKILDKH